MAISFDVKDIKPLLSGLKLGEAPDTTMKAPGALTPPPMSPAGPPPPPQPTPAVAGFSEWSADPQNQQKVAHAITQPGQPIIPQNVRQQATEMASLNPPPMPQAPMMASIGGPPVVPNPTSPAVTPKPNPLQTKLGNDQAELQRLQTTGPGVSQIKNKPGRVAAEIADVAGSILAPGAAAFVPGTTLHNQQLQRRAQGRIDSDQSALKDEADLAQKQAATAYEQARPDIEQNKIDQKQQAVRQRIQQEAASRGQSVTFDNDGVPTFTDNPDLQAYKTAAASAVLHQANAEKAQVWTTIQRNHYIPGTPEYAEAQRKLDQIDSKIKIAQGNLGYRALEYQAHAYGTGAGGQELPGVLHDTQGNPIGTWNAENVRPTTTEKDAAGRAETMTDIQARIEAGLKDPDIRNYMGPLGGRLAEAEGKLGTLPEKVAQFQNDLVSYGAFQAGLHPVRGIGALEYFDRVMGGLHQTPEQLAGKLKSNASTAGAVQRVGEPPTSAGNQRKLTAPNGPPMPPKQGGSPKEGDTKVNSSGDKVVYRGGKWGPA